MITTEVFETAEKDNTVEPEKDFTVIRLITVPHIVNRRPVHAHYQRRLAHIHVKAFTSGDAIKAANRVVVNAHSKIWPTGSAPWQTRDVDWVEVKPATDEIYVLRG